MKWYGWGDEHTHFPLRERPRFLDYLREQLGELSAPVGPVPYESIVLPQPTLPAAALVEMGDGAVRQDRIYLG